MGDSRDQVAHRSLPDGTQNKFEMKEKEGLLHKEENELDVIVVDGLEKTPSALTVEKPPSDRYYLVYFIFLIHGIGILMPWNMFINATDYFVNYKLAPGSSENSTEAKSDEIYRDYFLSSLCFVAQVPNVTLNGFNLFCRTKGGRTSRRVVWSIIVIVILFICTVVLAIVDSSSWRAAFFWITMVSVVVLNSANGIYQNSIYGLAACLPMKYTNAVVLGSNSSGALTAVIALISLAAAPDPRTCAIYYFLAAVFVLLVAFDMFFVLPMLPFYKYYCSNAEADNKKGDDGSKSENYLHLYWTVFKKSWKQDLSVFFVFFVTLSCFPAIWAGVERSSCDFFIPDKYFMGVTCFLLFNVCAMCGSLMAAIIEVPGPKWTWLPVLLRAVFIPFFMFSNFKPEKRTLPVLFGNDYLYCLGGIVMALSSGYLSSLTMMFAPRNVPDKHKGVAGMMAAFSLILGIFSGIIFSFPLTAVVENFGSSHYERLVCDLPGVAELVPVNASLVNGLDAVSVSAMSL